MDVKLVEFTAEPEILIAASARLCYTDRSAINLLEELSQNDIDRLLDTIISSGHHSVLEHVNFTFALNGLSRVLTHQLVRHRVGIAFSQQSQRYADVSNAGYVTPPLINKKNELKDKYEKLVNDCFELFSLLQENGIPNEDSRFILPQCISTRMVMTVNLRQIIHMYSINACLRSQWEIRKLMAKIKNEIHNVSPRLAKELKIKCFQMGYCDEKYMCDELKGRMPRQRDVMNAYRKENKDFYDVLEKDAEKHLIDE